VAAPLQLLCPLLPVFFAEQEIQTIFALATWGDSLTNDAYRRKFLSVSSAIFILRPFDPLRPDTLLRSTTEYTSSKIDSPNGRIFFNLRLARFRRGRMNTCGPSRRAKPARG